MNPILEFKFLTCFDDSANSFQYILFHHFFHLTFNIFISVIQFFTFPFFSLIILLIRFFFFNNFCLCAGGVLTASQTPLTVHEIYFLSVAPPVAGGGVGGAWAVGGQVAYFGLCSYDFTSQWLT